MKTYWRYTLTWRTCETGKVCGMEWNMPHQAGSLEGTLLHPINAVGIRYLIEGVVVVIPWHQIREATFKDELVKTDES